MTTLKNKIQYTHKLVIRFTLLLALISPLTVFCQQDPIYTQNTNNLMIFQPAYPGMADGYNFTILNRQQWIGFEGAPQTTTFSALVPFPDYNIGVGLSMIHDKYGPVRQDAVYFNFAYHIPVSDEINCSFGIMGGGNFYKAFLSELPTTDPNDPLAIQDIKGKFQPNIGTGILFNTDKYFLGFSVPKLLKNTIFSDTGSPLYHNDLSIYGMLGAEWEVENIKLKPNVFYRWNQNNPSLIDANMNVIFYDVLSLGTTYRFNNSFGFLFQIYPFKDERLAPLKIGLAYDLTTFHSTQINTGTYEVMISFNIPGTDGKGYRRYGKRKSCNTCRW